MCWEIMSETQLKKYMRVTDMIKGIKQDPSCQCCLPALSEIKTLADLWFTLRTTFNGKKKLV